MFKVGDKVKLRSDVLVRHAREFPARSGYTSTQTAWRKLLDRYRGKVGTIIRAFPNGHVNVAFRDGTVIGIGSSEMVKHKERRS